MIAPKLRFSEFKDEWIELSLKEYYSKIRNGFVGVATPFYVENGIKYLQGKNIKDGKIDPKGLIYISEDFHHKKNNSQLKQNDILMVQSGHVGECAVVTQDYENANCHALIILSPDHNEKVNSHFVVYYFYSHYGKKRISEIKTGNTIEHVLASEIKEVTLNFPTPKEQTKIAEFLSTVDNKISQLSRQLELLNQYKKGVMQKIFSQEIRFKNDNGEDFGEWDYFQASELFENYTNKNHDGNLTILAATQDKGIVPRDTIEIDIKSSEASVKSYKIIEKGQFVISLRSFQGGIEYSNYHGICSPAYTVLQPIKPINDIFYKNYLKTYDFIQRLSATVIGIRDGKQISYQAFSDLYLDYPTIPEQEKIAEFLTAIDEQIDHTTAQLIHTKQWKKGLLQQMFV